MLRQQSAPNKTMINRCFIDKVLDKIFPPKKPLPVAQLTPRGWRTLELMHKEFDGTITESEQRELDRYFPAKFASVPGPDGYSLDTCETSR